MARECGRNGCRLSSAHVSACAPRFGTLAVRPSFRHMERDPEPDCEMDAPVLRALREIDRWTVPDELALRSGCTVRALRMHVLPRLKAKGLVLHDKRFWRPA